MGLIQRIKIAFEEGAKEQFEREMAAAGKKGGEAAAKNIDQSLGGGVQSLAKKIAGWLAAAFAVQKITAFGVSAIKAFMDSEKAARSLQDTMTRFGGKATDVGKIMQQVGKWAITATTFGDNKVFAALDTLIIRTGDLNVALATLPVAADLAAKRNVDLATAAQALSGAMNGQERQLVALIGPLEKNRDLLEQVREKVGGGMQSEMTTFGGKVALLKNAWDEFKVKLGEALVTAGSGTSVLDVLTGSVVALGNFIAAHKEDIAAFGRVTLQAIADAADLTGKALTALKAVAEGLARGFKGVAEQLHEMGIMGDTRWVENLRFAWNGLKGDLIALQSQFTKFLEFYKKSLLWLTEAGIKVRLLIPGQDEADVAGMRAFANELRRSIGDLDRLGKEQESRANKLRTKPGTQWRSFEQWAEPFLPVPREDRPRGKGDEPPEPPGFVPGKTVPTRIGMYGKQELTEEQKAMLAVMEAEADETMRRLEQQIKDYAQLYRDVADLTVAQTETMVDDLQLAYDRMYQEILLRFGKIPDEAKPLLEKALSDIDFERSFEPLRKEFENIAAAADEIWSEDDIARVDRLATQMVDLIAKAKTPEQEQAAQAMLAELVKIRAEAMKRIADEQERLNRGEQGQVASQERTTEAVLKRLNGIRESNRLLQDQLRRVRDIAEGVIGIGKAAGLFDDEMADVLRTLTTLGGNLTTLINGIGQLDDLAQGVSDALATADEEAIKLAKSLKSANIGDIASSAIAIFGIASDLLGGLFGGESPEEKALRLAMEKNTEAIRTNTAAILGDVAGIEFGQTKGVLGGITAAGYKEWQKSGPSWRHWMPFWYYAEEQMRAGGIDPQEMARRLEAAGATIPRNEQGAIIWSPELIQQGLTIYGQAEQKTLGAPETYGRRRTMLEQQWEMTGVSEQQRLDELLQLAGIHSPALRALQGMTPEEQRKALADIYLRRRAGVVTAEEIGRMSVDEFDALLADLDRQIEAASVEKESKAIDEEHRAEFEARMRASIERGMLLGGSAAEAATRVEELARAWEEARQGPTGPEGPAAQEAYADLAEAIADLEEQIGGEGGGGPGTVGWSVQQELDIVTGTQMVGELMALGELARSDLVLQQEQRDLLRALVEQDKTLSGVVTLTDPNGQVLGTGRIDLDLGQQYQDDAVMAGNSSLYVS